MKLIKDLKGKCPICNAYLKVFSFYDAAGMQKIITGQNNTLPI